MEMLAPHLFCVKKSDEFKQKCIDLCFGHQFFSVVGVTRPLPRDEGMVEDHGAPEARQLPKA